MRISIQNRMKMFVCLPSLLSNDGTKFDFSISNERADVVRKMLKIRKKKEEISVKYQPIGYYRNVRKWKFTSSRRQEFHF